MAGAEDAEGARVICAIIEGFTRICGKAQGYKGLPLRDIKTESGTPAMVTAWTPTPEELAALNLGASVHVTILGSVPPPMMVGVGTPPTNEEAPDDRQAATKP